MGSFPQKLGEWRKYSPIPRPRGMRGNGGNADFAPEMAPFAPENMPFAPENGPHSPIPILATKG
eukprot:COSAG06_NODE_8303_length_2207_cov_7929.583491_3_plen_63_part_01